MPDRTVTIYRITHRRYQADPFSGKGGLQYRSRWASKGQLVSYAADHLATATLEKMAGVKRLDLLSEMIYAKAEVEARHIKTLPEDEWPEDWDALPATDATRTIGDDWLQDEESVLLRVPAVVLPNSYNYVIDAAHPHADVLQPVETARLLLDSRVLRHMGISQE